jgi:hypothetical protein
LKTVHRKKNSKLIIIYRHDTTNETSFLQSRLQLRTSVVFYNYIDVKIPQTERKRPSHKQVL